jgi:hypothetical protein
VSTQKPTPQLPELKTLIANLRGKTSPKKRLKDQAAVIATDIISNIRRQSRPGK